MNSEKKNSMEMKKKSIILNVSKTFILHNKNSKFFF